VHAPSLLLGAGLVAGALALSAASSPSAAPKAQESEINSTGVGSGLWRDVVRIVEGDPFTVPEGKVLVIQSCGFVTREPSDPILIGEPLMMFVDGVRSLILVPTSANHEIAPGWAAPQKSQVTLSYGGDPQIGYLFGYLIDA
jgi:hypothetical protein